MLNFGGLFQLTETKCMVNHDSHYWQLMQQCFQSNFGWKSKLWKMEPCENTFFFFNRHVYSRCDLPRQHRSNYQKTHDSGLKGKLNKLDIGLRYSSEADVDKCCCKLLSFSRISLIWIHFYWELKWSEKAAFESLGREHNILRSFPKFQKSNLSVPQQRRQFMFQSNVYPAWSQQ